MIHSALPQENRQTCASWSPPVRRNPQLQCSEWDTTLSHSTLPKTGRNTESVSCHIWLERPLHSGHSIITNKSYILTDPLPLIIIFKNPGLLNLGDSGTGNISTLQSRAGDKEKQPIWLQPNLDNLKPQELCLVAQILNSSTWEKVRGPQFQVSPGKQAKNTVCNLRGGVWGPDSVPSTDKPNT